MTFGDIENRRIWPLDDFSPDLDSRRLNNLRFHYVEARTRDKWNFACGSQEIISLNVDFIIR